MSRTVLGLILALLALPARAQVSVPAAESTAASEIFSEVTSTSTNAGLNADVLQLAESAREQLAPILNLGGRWRFPVNIVVVTPDDPKAPRVHGEHVVVEAIGDTMRIDATLPSTDPDARAFIQRQFVTALLWEKFFAQSKSFDTDTRLDLVPIWLIEGLNEWLDRDAGHDRDSIVRREAQAGRAPTLAEVASWQEISPDRLLGLYQRAFCFYLVNSLVQAGPKRDDFQQWLATIAKSGPSSARLLLPTESGWQRQLLQAPDRAHDLVFTWDESAGALAGMETIALPAKKAGDTRICTIDNVAAFPADPAMIAAVQKKIFDLTALELRAHPGWRPILEAYRFGLAALAGGHPDQARKLIAEAEQKRTNEAAYHQKLIDYINWFEVTKDYSSQTTSFPSYFSTAQEMERIQGDPDHPNPIRADVLRVESKL